MGTGQHPRKRDGNGQPDPAMSVPVPMQISPIIVEMNQCQIKTDKRPDGLYDVYFLHVTGVIGFHAVLSDEHLEQLQQVRSGIEIARLVPKQ